MFEFHYFSYKCISLGVKLINLVVKDKKKRIIFLFLKKY